MKFNTTGLKFSLLTGSLLLASAASAVGVSQQGNDIVFGELEQQRYQLKVKMPSGELKSFSVVDGRFTLTPEMLGLKSLNNGQYKYELVPVFVADKLAADVRSLGDAAVSAEYAKSIKGNSEKFSGVFTLSQNSLIVAEPENELGQPKNNKALDSDDPITRDQVILDDLIVDGSICAGMDCINGESFGFDTIRLKENNLRIKFQDTSASASFPSNDWQITANDSANGGANKFSIDDIDGGRTPFTIEASSPSHSLYVDDGGRIGLGTSTPVVELHVVNGDSPTLRLEQNGSSGFTPQTWDVAGNETNFFVRDATNGSKLPFKIRPNAPTNSLYVDVDGDIGLGTASPDARLHVIGSLLVDESDLGSAEATMHLRRSSGDAKLLIEEQSATTSARTLLELENNGNVRLDLTNSSAGNFWRLATESSGDNFVITRSGTSVTELELDFNGNLDVRGSLQVGGMTLIVPDYVFEQDYKLMPLDELSTFLQENKHLPKVKSAKTINAGKLNMTEMQLRLLEKVEELTLYTIEQHDTIKTLQTRLENLEK